MKSVSVSKLFFLLLLDAVKAVLYFPVWWYSKGLVDILKASLEFIKNFENSLGFSIWVKNLFIPMFGQRDIVNRLISFFLRLVQIIARGIILLVLIFLTVAFIVLWLVLPIIIILQLINLSTAKI